MKALLIDDERLARQELRRLLQAHAEVQIVGEAANAQEAKVAIDRWQPDLLFLDVQMPGKTGFQLLEELDDVPVVIFTTAYDQYAVRAFEVSALDYLVKPVAPERLARALSKARNLLESPEAPQESTTRRAPSQQVFVRDGDRCWMVKLTEIALLESEGSYTRIYFGKERPLVLRSLNALEERLDPEAFFRANRSQIINLRAIEQLDSEADNSLCARLRGGMQVQISRRQSRKLKELMSL
jgi:two-component system, LytTR family, response regulator